MHIRLAGIVLLFLTLSLSRVTLANSCIDQNDPLQIGFPPPFSLVEIISEPENNRIHMINLFLDDMGDILGLTRESGDDIQVICPEELFDGEVLLAKSSGGIDAVFLGCRDCTIYEGGRVNIRYLYNGAISSYRNFEMQLTRDGDDWLLETLEGEQINKLTLIARRIFGKIIGISEIEVN